MDLLHVAACRYRWVWSCLGNNLENSLALRSPTLHLNCPMYNLHCRHQVRSMPHTLYHKHCSGHRRRYWHSLQCWDPCDQTGQTNCDPYHRAVDLDNQTGILDSRQAYRQSDPRTRIHPQTCVPTQTNGQFREPAYETAFSTNGYATLADHLSDCTKRYRHRCYRP
jgi:hypothetical protein